MFRGQLSSPCLLDLKNFLTSRKSLYGQQLTVPFAARPMGKTKSQKEDLAEFRASGCAGLGLHRALGLRKG